MRTITRLNQKPDSHAGHKLYTRLEEAWKDTLNLSEMKESTIPHTLVILIITDTVAVTDHGKEENSTAENMNIEDYDNLSSNIPKWYI